MPPRRQTRGAIALLIALALVLQALAAPFLAAEARQRDEVARALGVICAVDGGVVAGMDGEPAPLDHTCPDCCLAACLRLALEPPPVVTTALALPATPPARVAAPPLRPDDSRPVATLARQRPSQPRAPPRLKA